MVPDDVRGRVAVYRGEIDKRLSRHRFVGSVYIHRHLGHNFSQIFDLVGKVSDP